MNRSQMIRARSSANDLAHEVSALMAVEGVNADPVGHVKATFYTMRAHEALQRVAAEMGFSVVALATAETMQAAE